MDAFIGRILLAEGQVFTDFLGRQIVLQQFVDGGLQISVNELSASFAKSNIGKEFVNVVRAELKKNNRSVDI